MTDRETLAARIEAAGVDEQRVMLCAAFQFLRGATASANEFWSDNPKPGAFHAKLNAGAYLDAAMMLVPEGWFVELEQHSSSWTATLSSALWYDDTRICRDAAAATPALALAAAAIRAGGV